MKNQKQMQLLLYRVLQLPTDLQIMISEFNPEHREKMRAVLEDIIETHNYCTYCYKTLVRFIYVPPTSRRTFCSINCITEYNNYDDYYQYIPREDNYDYLDD